MAMLFGLYGGVVGVLKNSAASVLFGIAIMCQALCQLLYMQHFMNNSLKQLCFSPF